MFNSNFPDRVPPIGRQPNRAGDKYGRLTLVEEVEGEGRSRWLVRCDCGEVRQVVLSSLRCGDSTSCGCYSREVTAETGRANATHGLNNHKLYKTHSHMLDRCHNPKNPSFQNYGNRGITVCERWHLVENFIADMSPTYSQGLTLERSDNNLGYSPENCVWATDVQQGRNKRNNRLVSYQGKNICLAEACEITGLPYARVLARLDKYGWPISKALGPEFGEPLYNE